MADLYSVLKAFHENNLTGTGFNLVLRFSKLGPKIILTCRINDLRFTRFIIVDELDEMFPGVIERELNATLYEMKAEIAKHTP